MLGNCKRCEFGHQYMNWCELKNRSHKPSGVKCDDYLEAGFIADEDMCAMMDDDEEADKCIDGIANFARGLQGMAEAVDNVRDSSIKLNNAIKTLMIGKRG